MIGQLLLSSTAVAEPADIPNYRSYSETLASAGQPSEEQLQDVWADGFERVVYLAFSDHQTSLENEDRIVKELGMAYVNIPVDWGAPTLSDFNLFAGALLQEPQKKTFVHCQANYRASAFSLLYRVIHEDVSLVEAKADMDSVWTPNTVWTKFILHVLKQNEISAECEGCDWTPEEH